MESTSDRSRIGLLLTLGLSVMLLGLAFCWLLARGYSAAKAYDSWIPTPAKVVSAWIETIPQPGSEPPRYEFQVRYAYNAGGAPQTGTRLKEIPGNTRQRGKVEKLENQFSVGNEDTCYVNPTIPGMAILIRPTKAPGYTLWFPGLFVIGGAGMCFSAIRRKRLP